MLRKIIHATLIVILMMGGASAQIKDNPNFLNGSGGENANETLTAREKKSTEPLIPPTESKLTMITKRRPVRFPIRSRTTLGAPFGHPALSTRRRQPLLAQKRSSNKPQLSCALTGGEYRQAAGVVG